MSNKALNKESVTEHPKWCPVQTKLNKNRWKNIWKKNKDTKQIWIGIKTLCILFSVYSDCYY